jgi:hypothetical protein
MGIGQPRLIWVHTYLSENLKHGDGARLLKLNPTILTQGESVLLYINKLFTKRNTLSDNSTNLNKLFDYLRLFRIKDSKGQLQGKYG